MQNICVERVINIGNYMAKNSTTIRNAARKFGVSKSTVHKDVTERLRKLNLNLYLDVKKVLETNKAQRHIRGGNATKMKYKLKNVIRMT